MAYGAIRATAQIATARTRLAPGNDAGMKVTARIAWTRPMNDRLRMTLELSEMPLTSPLDCRVKKPPLADSDPVPLSMANPLARRNYLRRSSAPTVPRGKQYTKFVRFCI